MNDSIQESVLDKINGQIQELKTKVQSNSSPVMIENEVDSILKNCETADLSSNDKAAIKEKVKQIVLENNSKN